MGSLAFYDYEVRSAAAGCLGGLCSDWIWWNGMEFGAGKRLQGNYITAFSRCWVLDWDLYLVEVGWLLVVIYLCYFFVSFIWLGFWFDLISVWMGYVHAYLPTCTLGTLSYFRNGSLVRRLGWTGLSPWISNCISVYLPGLSLLRWTVNRTRLWPWMGWMDRVWFYLEMTYIQVGFQSITVHHTKLIYFPLYQSIFFFKKKFRFVSRGEQERQKEQTPAMEKMC